MIRNVVENYPLSVSWVVGMLAIGAWLQGWL